MPDLTFWDAAYPLQRPPRTDGVCFYIGGDASHDWTEAEIGALTDRYRLPIFVRSDPTRASAADDVAAAVTRLLEIGAPKGTLVAWDSETAADPGYMQAVYHFLSGAGYKLIDYGSQYYVFGNENPDGYYWGADWTNVPHIARRDAMTQWVSFTGYDLSEAKPGLPFWDTEHKPVPPKPPVPVPPINTEKILRQLPQLAEGATGAAVRTAQGLCCARGHALTIDGDFGVLTRRAVVQVQEATGVTVSGEIDDNTWAVLMGVSA